MLLDQGTLVAGRYEIIEQIGVGGMAIVYMALDTKLNRKVSFKVLKEEHLADEFVFSKFSTEAKAVAILSNQNVVSVYDVGVEENIHYIVMEYIDGVTLKELIQQRAPFRNDEAIGVAIQIAQALSHAHANKVVHQDIKPQNILITNEGMVKVTDFGIASAQALNTDTTTTSTVGSVHYFSPEQARGRFVDHRSDIYSLGIVVYEMVTGKIPFEGDNQINIALSHINEELPPMPEHVSDSLERIILKATKKLSNQRYAHVDDMVEDLKLALTDEMPPADADDQLLQHTVVMSTSDQEAINAHVATTAEDTADETPTPDELAPEEIHTAPVPLPLPTPTRRGASAGNTHDHGHEHGHGSETKAGFDIFNPQATTQHAPDKRLEKKIILVGVATAVVLALIILIIMLLALTSGNGGNNAAGAPPTIVLSDVVPDVVGLDWESAADLVYLHGLQVTWVPEYSDTVPLDMIVQQNPVAGTSLADGLQTVTLAVSRGPFSYEVPNFIGQTWVDVQTMLENVPQIQLMHTTVPSDAPLSTIISQTPAEGITLGAGGIIEVVISSGPATVNVNVPNMIGLTEAAAVAMLQQAELTASISRVHHDDILAGNVIAQGTVAGMSLPTGGVVGLTISLGQAPAQENAPPTDTDNETDADTANESETANDEAFTEPPTDTDPNDEPVYVRQTIVFGLPADFDHVNNPLVHVVAIANQQVIFDSQIPHGSFPISVPVDRQLGSGSVNVQFFMFGQLRAEEILTF